MASLSQIDQNRRDVAALALTTGKLYTLASGSEGYVAPLAMKVADACQVLKALVTRGAGNLYHRGHVAGIDEPTGRGALIPRGTPATDITDDLRASLADVPTLVYGAWVSLQQYDREPEHPWTHLEEAAWRLADANLLLALAAETTWLSRRLVTLDHPTLPFVPNPAWHPENPA